MQASAGMSYQMRPLYVAANVARPCNANFLCSLRKLLLEAQIVLEVACGALCALCHMVWDLPLSPWDLLSPSGGTSPSLPSHQKQC